MWVLFDTFSHLLPFHHHTLKLFSVADVQMFLYMISCLSVTVNIVWKMGWGNLHALFHWGLETCLAREKFVLREQPLWEMTVVYSNWLWCYECWKIPVKRYSVSPAVNKPPSKQSRSSHNRWALLMSPLFQHWGDISRLIALDYRRPPWILITLEMSDCN